ncbi:MAG: hypothetical protein EAZ57_11830 [Cytophagales bacterium]|nr:MAG: hypothetical protein EAZ67_13755 [Cytophagales bacterium]TAF59234.1 MAG: hypothetical protein EAZ57_11830 [Cytophagales bacterium]
MLCSLKNHFKTYFISFLLVVVGIHPLWALSEIDRKCYADILSLQQSPALQQLSQRKDMTAQFLKQFQSAVYLALSEDYNQKDKLIKQIEAQIDVLEAQKLHSETFYFCYTELLTVLAIVKIRFEMRLGAVWTLRKAFAELSAFQSRFPKSKLPLKNLGALNVLSASAPPRYQWAMKLIGLSGNQKKGFQMLDSASQGTDPRALQARVYKMLLQTYVLRAQTEFLASQLLLQNPTNNLIMFFHGMVLLRNKKNKEAQKLFQSLLPIQSKLPYAQYAMAETLLYELNYDKAKQHYEQFLLCYHGQNFRKDAHFKLFIIHYLSQSSLSLETKTAYAQKINEAGIQSTEQDAYASKVGVNIANISSPALIKARLAYDGGYFNEALALLQNIDINVYAPKSPQRTELYYRLGLIFLNMKVHAQALKWLDMAYNEGASLPHFYAANAALQLGLLYRDVFKDPENARLYWQHALDTPEHEYKNAIDDKAHAYIKQSLKK